MKILVISQYFWPEQFVVNELCTSLKAKGHEVTVLTGVPNYPSGKVSEGYSFLFPKSEDYEGVRVIRVPLVPRGKGGGIRLVLNYLSYMVTASLLGPLLCRGSFDLIFVMQLSPATVGVPAIFFKWLKKAPIVFWVQDLWPESLSASGAIGSKRVINWVGKLMKLIYRSCDEILVQSRSFKEKIREIYPQAKRITYFPNWAPTTFEEISLAEKGNENIFNVVFAGNLGAAQNLEVIVGAAERLQGNEKIRWTFIGTGRRLDWLKNQVRARGLSHCVHFMGRKRIEEMPSLLSQADCLLVTLKKDPIFEITIPSKIQAYLACGKPIVASVDGEGAKVIKEANVGFCGASENAALLAENVKKVFDLGGTQRAQLGANGRAYFEDNFSHGKLVCDLEDILKATLRTHKL